eukprot:1564358-Pleurochrysis_carterae.AAC.1
MCSRCHSSLFPELEDNSEEAGKGVNTSEKGEAIFTPARRYRIPKIAGNEPVNPRDSQNHTREGVGETKTPISRFRYNYLKPTREGPSSSTSAPSHTASSSAIPPSVPSKDRIPDRR